jgi:hypothetical protein
MGNSAEVLLVESSRQLDSQTVHRQAFCTIGLRNIIGATMNYDFSLEIIREYIIKCIIQGSSKTALQWYSKCHCGASVTKTFTFKGVKLSIVQDLDMVRNDLSFIA